MNGYQGGWTYDTSTLFPLFVWYGEDVRDRTVGRLMLLIMSGFLILNN
jgi:hypothetical protein